MVLQRILRDSRKATFHADEVLDCIERAEMVPVFTVLPISHRTVH